MHNARMAAADTNPPESQEEQPPTCGDCRQCPCYADQEALGRLLSEDPDPHVRIIAHMSNRQLALAESIGDLTKLIFKTAGAVHTLQEHSSNVTGELRRVTTTLEGLVASVDKLTGAVDSLSSKQSSLEERTGTLEEAFGAPASMSPV